MSPGHNCGLLSLQARRCPPGLGAFRALNSSDNMADWLQLLLEAEGRQGEEPFNCPNTVCRSVGVKVYFFFIRWH